VGDPIVSPTQSAETMVHDGRIECLLPRLVPRLMLALQYHAGNGNRARDLGPPMSGVYWSVMK
jgi:hypothetical protein